MSAVTRCLANAALGCTARQQLPFLFLIFSSTRTLRFGSTNEQVQVLHFLVFLFLHLHLHLNANC